MVLCASCRAVDFQELFDVARRSKEDDFSPFQLSRPQRHHNDIFDVQHAAKKCRLCRMIFQAFKERRQRLPHVELARGVPLVFRAQGRKVEVCFQAEGKFPKLCDLYWHMSGDDVDKAFKDLSIIEDQAPPFYRMVAEDPRSKASLDIASSWMHNCVDNHQRCKPTFSAPPKRLLRIGNKGQAIVLIETAYAAQTVSWAALSYCWGGQPSKKLTTKTMDELKKGVPFDDLDATIQDAIFVTRALGLSFLWIDALCIVQDKALCEWEEEATRMSDIYGGSAVTLVAAASHAVNEGFLHARKHNYVSVLRVNDHKAQSRRVYLSRESHLSARGTKQPWAKRGWTMQEAYLPNRVLHYTSSQIIWDCCEERRFECGMTHNPQEEIDMAFNYGNDLELDYGYFWRQDTYVQLKGLADYLRRHLGDSNYDSRDAFQLWYYLVQEYSVRTFSKESDRLLGISGLARLFGGITQSQGYAAGLWKDDMIRGLTWYAEDAKLLPSNPANTDFPSWSWASVGGSRVTTRFRGRYTAFSEINDVRLTLVDPASPFASIRNGTITITGPVQTFTRVHDSNWRSCRDSFTALEADIFELIEDENLKGRAANFRIPRGGHFAALQMLSSDGFVDLLILESLGRNINGYGAYRRIGLHTVSIEYADPASDADPDFIAIAEEYQSSLSAKLEDEQIEWVGDTTSEELKEELRKQTWHRLTVVLV